MNPEPADKVDFLHKVFMNHARNNKNLEGNYGKQGEPNCYYVRDFVNPTGFAYIYINNRSKQTLKETFKFNGSQGLYFLHPFKGPEITYKVLANSEALCLYKLDKRTLKLKSKVIINFEELQW